MRKPIPTDIVESEISLIRSVILREINPSRLFLFGSASEGRMTDQSDYDLLIIMSNENDIKKGKLSWKKNRASLPKRSFDVIWMTLCEFERKKTLGVLP